MKTSQEIEENFIDIKFSNDYLLLSTNDSNLSKKIIDFVLEYSDNV